MNWTAVKAFTLKELKQQFRDKAGIFWIFIWPAIWLLLTAYVFIPPAAGNPMTIQVGVVNQDYSTAPVNGSLLIKVLNETEYKGVRLFDVEIYGDKASVIDALRRGRLDCGILIPSGFGRSLIFGQARLEVYIGARDPQSAQVTESIIKGFIQRFNEEIAVRKINESMKFISKYAASNLPKNFTEFWNGNKSFAEIMKEMLLGYAAPVNASYYEVKPPVLESRETLLGWYTFGAMGMAMMYTGLMIGSGMVVEEKERGTLRRILASPASPADMLVGKTLAGLIILALMSIFIGILGVSVCGAKLALNPLLPEHWLAISLIPVTALMTIGIGLLLSLIARTEKAASNLSVSLGLMLAFLTGIWFPRSWLPSWMRIFADIFPGTWAIDSTRSLLVYGASVAEVIAPVLGSFLAAAAAYSLGVLAFKRVLRRYAES